MTLPYRLGLVTALATGAILGGLATNAVAADLPPLPPPPVQAAPVTIGSGWYLRGDFTQSWSDHPRDGTRADASVPPLVGLRLSPEGGYGGGVGYQINPWLRVDATIDQRAASSFRAYSSGSNFARGYNLEAGKLDVLTGLVNIYADLGTWYGFTPYVGAGIGVADKRMSRNYTQTTCLVDGCDGPGPAGPREAALRANKSVATFAWALTAGLSYDVGAGVSIDAAYRYVDLGRAKSGLDPFGGSTRLKDLAASEFRVGLRYRFADSLLPVGLQQSYGN